MSDTPTAGALAPTPSTEGAAKELRLTEEQLQSLLDKSAEKNTQMIKEMQEKLDAKAKETDPATRPDMKATITDPAQAEKKGPGLEADEIKAIKEFQKKLPSGGRPKATDDLDDYTNPYFKNVQKLDGPRGEVMDNWSAGRLCYAITQKALGNADSISKYAPWEMAYADWQRKAQAESNGQDGGFLAPEEWVNTYYGILRPAMILSQLPITFRNVGFRTSHFPVMTGDVTVGYAAENAALTASQFAYSQRTATMRKQFAYAQIANEVLRDWLPAADNNIRVECARAMARDRDKQVLLGNGQLGAPIGLLNMTNVTTSAVSAAPNYGTFHTGITAVENLNTSANVPTGEARCTGIVGSVQLKHSIFQLKDVTNNRPLLDMSSRFFRNVAPAAGGQAGPGDLAIPGYGQPNGVEAALPDSIINGWLGIPNWVFSNLLPIGSGGNVMYGDWQYLIVFMRQDIEVMASNVAGTAFANDQTWVRLIARYDVQCAHPEAFFIQTSVASGVVAG